MISDNILTTIPSRTLTMIPRQSEILGASALVITNSIMNGEYI